MKINTLKISIIILCLSYISCKTEPKSFYIEGTILNTISNFVYISDQDGIIDTLYLDDKNSFSTTIKNNQPRLYRFEHEGQHQFFYAENKDSISFLVDRKKFDKSLKFNGTKQKHNNLLANLTRQNMDFWANYNFNNYKDYESFMKNLNEYKEHVISLINKFKKETPNSSKYFNEILNITLTHSYYNHVERSFAFEMYKDLKKFDYTRMFNIREKLNLTRDSLLFYFPYRSHLTIIFRNNTSLKGYRFLSDDFVNSFYTNIHNFIKTPKFKDDFLKKSFYSCFYRKDSDEKLPKSTKKYFELSTNEKDKELISKLIEASKTFKKGEIINNFKLIDANNKEIPIHKLGENKKVVLYFDNSVFHDFEISSDVLKMLLKTYPELTFVQITFNKNKNPQVKFKHSYKLTDQKLINKISDLGDSCFVLLNNNEIQNDFLGSFSKDLKKQMDQFNEL